MPYVFDKPKACVEFALRKLEDLWNLEAALLSGATSVSEAGDLMVSVKSMLLKINLVLVDDDDDGDKKGAGAGVMELITEVVDVCIFIELALFNFSIEAGRTIPTESIPEAVMRISTKPVDLFVLNRFASEMKDIQSQLHNIIKNVAFMNLTNSNHADVTLRAFPQSPLTIDEVELVGYEALQKSIIDKLLDPTILQRLQVAILGPEAAGKTVLVEKIYQNLSKRSRQLTSYKFLL